eukprot:CAMPEP_0174839306 /NCGR_PEP_ID=MMETSP1114-20130205/7954_1 /TAXON_ID=312471 /ORGANISM="Neobodo designis, Strain CCAP 1951/1" /LENGTH=466 /DNA_ID=CAMNT_0016073427 /DNA_START=48 /DNA_END=1445 /DNA_ORIENTATION=+
MSDADVASQGAAAATQAAADRAEASEAAGELQCDAVLDAVRSANEGYLGFDRRTRVAGRHRPFDVPAAANTMLALTLLAKRRAAERSSEEDATEAAEQQPTALPWLVVRALVDAMPEPRTKERTAQSMHCERRTQIVMPARDMRHVTPVTWPALRVSPWIDRVYWPSANRLEFRNTALRRLPADMPWLRCLVVPSDAGLVLDAIGWGVAPEIVASTEQVVKWSGDATEPPARPLESLRVSAGRSTPSAALLEVIKFAFQRHPVSLRSLDASSFGGCQDVAKYIASLTTLESLSITTGNPDSVAGDLLTTIPSPPPVMQRLDSFELVGEGMTLDRMHIHTLFGAAQLAPMLTSLAIVSCGVVSDSFIAVCRSLDADPAVLPMLRELSFATNLIDDAAVSQLAGCRRVWCKLEALDLRSNPFKEYDGLNLIVQCFQRSASLKRLRLYPAGGHNILLALKRINAERGSG